MEAPFTYATVCSGAEAFGPAWHRLGMVPTFHAEIDYHAANVLHYRFPNVPNHGDFTQIKASAADGLDLLAGGTPCQDFSVAGLRAGIVGDRGNLTLQFLLLVKRLAPRWVLWENVAGSLSSVSHDAPDALPPQIDLDGDHGPADGEEVVVEDEYAADEHHAFATFLDGLSELGYGIQFRVLDAQYFGVAQKRRRVFVVGYFGDWRPAAAVLSELEGLRGDSAPSRSEGQAVAGTLTARAGSSSGTAGGRTAPWDNHLVAATLTASYGQRGGGQVDCAVGNQLIPESRSISYGGGVGEIDISPSLLGHNGRRDDYDSEALVMQCHGSDVGQFGSLTAGSGSVSGGIPFTFGWNKSAAQTMNVSSDLTDPLKGSPSSMPAVFTPPLRYGPSHQDVLHFPDGQLNNLPAGTHGNGGHYTKTFHAGRVRRLTEIECERLMGWPDDWTRYGTTPEGRTYELPAGARYRICGNGWVEPNATWIAQRIVRVNSLISL